jgi:hypothetical protein
MQTTTSLRAVATERVMQYLLTRDDTFAVSRADEDPECEGTGVDLVWYWIGNKPPIRKHTITVTGDRFDSDAVFLEYSNDWHAVAVMASAADYLFYYVMTTHRLHIVRYPALRAFLDAYGPKLDTVAVKRGETFMGSFGAVIPIADFMSIPNLKTETA